MSAITLSPIATRFAWKEYRTLRGLWLAVLVLGVLVQLVLMLLAAPGADVPSLTVAAAWGTAVLYAIGAAAILFSVEHEEETYGFLAGLPARWLPLYLGKLCVAAASALAAALVLMLTGWVIASGRWPTSEQMALLLGLLGIGVVEALAWGTLFSLLLKRPLVAVLWTIVVGAIAVHWAVNTASSTSVASLELASYREAIPLRLAIVAIVCAGSAVAACRWLAADRPRGTSGAFVSEVVTDVGGYITQFRSPSSASPGFSRRGMLTRLLWQTWRNSWKMLLLPFIIAALLYGGVLAVGGFVVGAGFASVLGLAVAFLLPSLYGAMTFGADQRRASHRFLAEHAARPRYVWLTRIFVWLGSLLAISVALRIAVSAVTSIVFQQASNPVVDAEYWIRESTRVFIGNLYQATRFVSKVSFVAWFGALAAYGIGQLCSMLLRSEILAVFLAITLSVVLSAWVALVAVWDLSAWVFLLPLLVGTMAATWLRAPDWLIDRNSWRAWWMPVLAVMVSPVLVGTSLPIARELPGGKSYHNVAGWLPTEVYKSKAGERPSGDTPEARETAKLYESAAQKITAGQEHDSLEGSETRQQRPNQASTAAAAALIEASRRPSCWFEVDWSQTPVPERFDPHYSERESAWKRIQGGYYAALYMPLNFPLDRLSAAQAVDFHLAAVRMLSHLREGQPTDVTVRTLSVERQVLERIVDWASKRGAPTDQIRAVFDGLREYFASAPIDPTASFAADDRIVRDVLLGKTQPLILAETPIDISYYLAFLANELPWERRRALAALDMITMQNYNDARSLDDFIRRNGDFTERTWLLQHWIHPINYGGEVADAWLHEQPAAATSYLARFEYLARVRVRELFQQVLETETARRAAIVRLALLLYHRDHDKYPIALSELVPEYLAEIPTDPFTGPEPLSYAPAGVDALHTRYENNGAAVENRRTPIVWSAGPTNVRLKRREIVSRTMNEADPYADAIEHRTFYDVLEGDPDSWYRGFSLIFPLPK